MPLAQENIEKGLDLATQYSLMMPGQYLYSTKAEIAFAFGAMDEAKKWFTQALDIAEKFNNMVHAANIRANLGRVAQKQGQLDEALALLTAAQQTVADVITPHLQTLIDLWLAELYLERHEPVLGQQLLDDVNHRLKGTGRGSLQAWAKQVQEKL